MHEVAGVDSEGNKINKKMIRNGVKKKSIEEIREDLRQVYRGILMLEFCLISPESILDLPEELLRNIVEIKQLSYSLDFENHSINRFSIERGIKNIYSDKHSGEVMSDDFADEIVDILRILGKRVQLFYKETVSFDCRNEGKHVYQMKLLVEILDIFVLKWVKFLNKIGEENWLLLKKKNKVEIKERGKEEEEKEKLSKKKVGEEESLLNKKKKDGLSPVKSAGVEVFAEIPVAAAARENKGEEMKKDKEEIKKRGKGGGDEERLLNKKRKEEERLFKQKKIEENRAAYLERRNMLVSKLLQNKPRYYDNLKKIEKIKAAIVDCLSKFVRAPSRALLDELRPLVEELVYSRDGCLYWAIESSLSAKIGRETLQGYITKHRHSKYGLYMPHVLSGIILENLGYLDEQLQLLQKYPFTTEAMDVVTVGKHCQKVILLVDLIEIYSLQLTKRIKRHPLNEWAKFLSEKME